MTAKKSKKTATKELLTEKQLAIAAYEYYTEGTKFYRTQSELMNELKPIMTLLKAIYPQMVKQFIPTTKKRK